MSGLNALLIYAALSLALMTTYVGYRVGMVALRGKPADTWTRGSDAVVPGFVKRAQDAHINVVENLPVFGAIVLGASMLGRESLVDEVAVYILAARLAQTATHLIGVNHVLVLLRETFYTVQVALFAYLIYKLIAG